MIKKRRHIFFLTVILALSIVSAPVFAKGQDKKKDTKDSTQATAERRDHLSLPKNQRKLIKIQPILHLLSIMTKISHWLTQISLRSL